MQVQNWSFAWGKLQPPSWTGYIQTYLGQTYLGQIGLGLNY